MVYIYTQDTAKQFLYKIENIKEHSFSVAKYCRQIGAAVGLSDSQLINLLIAAELHDIGKIYIPDDILNKPGKLNDTEIAIIKSHPAYGAFYLEKRSFSSDVIKGVLYHHERYDGKGYPFGLKGENIPLFARIIAIADSFDAMTSKRVYKNALSYSEAMEEIKKNAGTQFDPEIAEIFLDILNLLV
jgi:putative nucleotidyltransferase with HDIG domain